MLGGVLLALGARTLLTHGFSIKLAVTNQLKELNHMRVPQQIRTPLDVSGVIFEAVRGCVHALAAFAIIPGMAIMRDHTSQLALPPVGP